MKIAYPRDLNQFLQHPSMTSGYSICQAEEEQPNFATWHPQGRDIRIDTSAGDCGPCIAEN